MRIRTGCRRNIGFLLLAFSASAISSESVVFGPVEKVSAAEISVLGHTYQIDDAAFCSVRDSGNVTSDPVPFDTSAPLAAFVAGSREADGGLSATDVCIATEEYVPGATDVLVEGKISAIDSTMGVVKIAGLSIYIGSAADLSSIDLSLDASILVIGRQFVAGGQVWANKVSNSVRQADNQTADVSGRIALGVVNNEGQSITGTGRQTANLVNVQSITGTGRQASNLVSIQSITGTGRQTSNLASTQSITGTGRQTSNLVSAQSITGTGRQTSNLVSTQSITGTGRQTSNLVSTQSITGTGRQTSNLVSTQSITGTGRSPSAQ